MGLSARSETEKETDRARSERAEQREEQGTAAAMTRTRRRLSFSEEQEIEAEIEAEAEKEKKEKTLPPCPPPTALFEAPETTRFDSVYRNSAGRVLPYRVDTSATVERRNAQMIRIVRLFCPWMFADNRDRIDVAPLHGGLSNEIFVVRSPVTQRTVLVRVHPDDDDNDDRLANDSDADDDDDDDDDSTDESSAGDAVQISHRQLENQLVAWLSEQDMAPVFYGRFRNGRVEEFYHNVTSLTCEDMPLHARSIATVMAKFHQLPIPADILPRPDPSRLGAVAPILDAWFDSAFQHTRSSFSKNNREQSQPRTTSSSSHTALPFSVDNQRIRTSLHSLHRQWQWLQTTLSHPPTTPTDNPVLADRAYAFIRQTTLTHMDCQPLNILKRVSDRTHHQPPPPTANDPTVKLIDFEYAGWNPRAADIANTFCEHCNMTNLTPNYEQEYPTQQQQNNFFQAYLRQADPRWAAQLDNDNDNGNDSWNTVLAAFRYEVGRFTLLSHLHWAVWCIDRILRFQRMQHHLSDHNELADWDYMKYLELRMQGYDLMKSWFFSSSPNNSTAPTHAHSLPPSSK